MKGHPKASPLYLPDWQYIEKTSLEDFTRADWNLLGTQRTRYYADEQAKHVLRMLAASEHDATFGYQVNNYRHSLQSATMALRDGLDEEDVVVAMKVLNWAADRATVAPRPGTC